MRTPDFLMSLLTRERPRSTPLSSRRRGTRRRTLIPASGRISERKMNAANAKHPAATKIAFGNVPTVSL